MPFGREVRRVPATFVKIAHDRKMRRRTSDLFLPPFLMCEALGARNNSAAKGHAKRQNNGYFWAPHLRENAGPLFRLYELKIGRISGWQKTRRTFFSVPSAAQRSLSDLSHWIRRNVGTPKNGCQHELKSARRPCWGRVVHRVGTE